MIKYFFKMHSPNSQKGLTMVELMVALVLSSLLTLGVIQVFIANKTSYRLQEAQARLQENARFALSVISNELRNAGHLGCASSSLTIDTGSIINGSLAIPPAPATFRPWTGIEGWEADGTAFGEAPRLVGGVFDPTGTVTPAPAQPTPPSPAPSWTTADGATLDTGTMSVADSDIIRVWYAESTFANITSLGTDPTFSALSFTAGDVFVLNDCAVAEFIQACDGPVPGATATTFDATSCTTPGNTLNAGIPATTVRDNNSEIRKLHGTVFYVGKRGDDPDNPPSLFWRELGSDATAANAEELVEGVESIQFMYGEDTDNDNAPNAYVPADLVTDWTQITSVKVSLLMRSVITSIENNADTSGDQNITTTDQTINFNGDVLTPTDGRLRRVFSTTVAFRNKLI
jgi:type IV pilus assembly protein PilW